MVGMAIPGWALAGLAAYSALSTLAADGLALGWRPPASTERSWLWLTTCLAASAVWAAMVFVAGVLAVRYAERMEQFWIGLLAYAVGAFGLSVVRAKLFARVGAQEVGRFWTGLVHAVTYPLTALVVYLLLAGLLQRQAEPWLVLALFVGALLPGLVESLPWDGHSLAGIVTVSLVAAPLIPLLGLDGWALLVLGYMAHLLVDLLRPAGIAGGWPLRKKPFRLWGGLAAGSSAERWAVLLLTGLAALLLTRVEVRPAQAPATPVLSFEQSVARYYSLRGRTLVFAQVWGSWQASGRPASGRFEILNADGSSLILLDRYDGTVFSAGRESTDDFYIDSISLSTGSAVRIKPVELHLEQQYMAEALPTLYGMQQEPGLEHIFVSGDLLVGLDSEPAPMPSLVQSKLRPVELVSPGHYRLNYLTAAELRELAEIPVITADLIVVATYRTPAEGPAATPLPPMPLLPETQP